MWAAKVFSVFYLGPGQPLISGFVQNFSSTFGFLLPQLRVMSQNMWVGLQHVVEDVEAVRAPNLWPHFHGTGLWVVQVPVGAHQSQQLQLHWADVPCRCFRVGHLIQIFPAILQKFVKDRELCVFLGADGAKPLQRAGRLEAAQFWPLNIKKKKHIQIQKTARFKELADFVKLWFNYRDLTLGFGARCYLMHILLVKLGVQMLQKHVCKCRTSQNNCKTKSQQYCSSFLLKRALNPF